MKLLNLNIQLFASASATQTIYSNGSSKYGYDISVSWEEQSGYDAEKNTTSIKGYASLYGKNVNFDTSTGGTLYFDWYDNRENTWKNKASLAIKKTVRGTTYKAEATFSVEHNADGSLKGKARVRWDKTGTNQWIPNDGSKETSEQTLTTIPRATKLGNHSGTIGTKLPFTWARAANFTHTLEITFGSKKYTYPGLTTGYEWLVPQDSPNELYQQMGGKIGTGTIKLTTYSGSTPIGTAQTAQLTLSAVEANVNPIIGTSTFVDTNSAMVGITNGTDVIVANKSLTQINFTFSTRGYAKAKTLLINNVSRTIPTGVVRSGDASITDYNVSVDLGTIKTNSFTISVTDTRNYPANSTPKIDDAKFIDYIPLDVSSSFKRIAPTTGEVGMTFNGNFWEGNFGKVTNSLTISYKYKKKDDTTYSNLITLVKDTDYKISNNKYYSGTGSSQDVIELEALFDYKSIYDVQFFVSDAVTTLPTINLVITKGIPIFWWNGEKVVVNGELYIADTNGENLQPVGGGDALPIDSIFEYDGDTVPDGYVAVDPSLAQMYVYGIDYLSENKYITSWYSPTSLGDFYCDTTNGRIVIPAGSAKVVEVYGLLCGYGYYSSRIWLDNNGNTQAVNILGQPQGNRYWSMPFPSKIMIIPDTTKDTYIKLECGPYNGVNFEINNGFGSSSYIGVKKIS